MGQLVNIICNNNMKKKIKKPSALTKAKERIAELDVDVRGLQSRVDESEAVKKSLIEWLGIQEMIGDNLPESNVDEDAMREIAEEVARDVVEGASVDVSISA